MKTSSIIEKSQCTLIGRLTKPHGVEGCLILRNEFDLSLDIEDLEPVFLEIQGGLVPFFFNEVRITNANSAIVGFDYITTQEKAKELVNVDVYALSESISDIAPNPLALQNLIGYVAFDITIGKIGVIENIIESKMNPLFEIKKGTILIPANDDLIHEIDDNHKTITFKLPEGLLDL